MFRHQITTNCVVKFLFLRLLVIFTLVLKVTCDSTAEDEDEDRLFNARNIDIKEAPFMVQITSDHGIFQCGGTIVSPVHVVTAAHCLHGSYLQRLRVVANATYANGDGRILREIDGFFQHPNYTRKSHDNDVAVLKLKEPLVFGKGIRKVRSLCKKPLLDDDILKVYGWGVTENGSMSDHLQTVEVKAMTHQNCLKRIKKGLTRNMVCAKVEDMKDTCEGDSGGPAIHEGQLCGIVSWGKHCGGKKPGVYINIMRFKKFINRSKKL